jgi:hypothetical protein
MKNRWLVFAVYLILVFVFYHKALQVYFLWDDWKLFYLLDRYGFFALTFNFESEVIYGLFRAHFFLFVFSFWNNVSITVSFIRHFAPRSEYFFSFCARRKNFQQVYRAVLTFFCMRLQPDPFFFAFLTRLKR